MADEFASLDATAQADLVRTGKASALELVDAAIARIETVNPTLNAVIAPLFEEARSDARKPVDGPFRGVPFLLKDLGAVLKGMPQYLGNRVLKEQDRRAPADTVLATRFRDAGFICLGKTNVPELGPQPTTQPVAFGPTHNPWDVKRSPSGSSGGSAAAVAAGAVAVAHANDGGGSIRLPAAWCGLVGLKPSRGRIPDPNSMARNNVELCVSRSVRDTAGVLDAVHGNVPGDYWTLPTPVRRYVDEVGADPGRLRIALLTDGGGLDIDRSCVDATESVARLLEKLGHDILPVGPEVLFDEVSSRGNGVLWNSGLARSLDRLSELAGRPMGPDDVEPFTWTVAVRGREMTAPEYMKALEQQHAWSAGVSQWMDAFDLLLTPTAGEVPALLDELVPPAEKPWRIGRRFGRIGRFTLPFNVTGHPAISLPMAETDDGLPVGIQLVGGMGREDVLLRVAAQLEAAEPWADRWPTVRA
jgi:amidase